MPPNIPFSLLSNGTSCKKYLQRYWSYYWKSPYYPFLLPLSHLYWTNTTCHIFSQHMGNIQTPKIFKHMNLLERLVAFLYIILSGTCFPASIWENFVIFWKVFYFIYNKVLKWGIACCRCDIQNIDCWIPVQRYILYRYTCLLYTI